MNAERIQDLADGIRRKLQHLAEAAQDGDHTTMSVELDEIKNDLEDIEVEMDK